ncbi:hypothetical protein [Novosphingobium sp. HII-3]|uniref:hypothetical protein n=1 Tax=Novosphingobium sp. HII-3 TaxID=2075565 RepID=UPI0011AEFC10|nr:hypothetical protein [Novosphingobium sp. HII-3]
MALALIDPFTFPYTGGQNPIRTALEAAKHTVVHYPDNGLGNYICGVLDASAEYKAWIKAMPAKKPKAIATYQSNYDKRNDADVNSDILTCGDTLDVGQILFHGGHWTGGTGTTVMSRPLSTTFNPNVAFANALWKAKAYDAGRLDLIVLETATAATKAYVFNRRGDLSHEREILLPANTTLKFIRETCQQTAYNVTKVGCPDKTIPIYVVEVEVS